MYMHVTCFLNLMRAAFCLCLGALLGKSQEKNDPDRPSDNRLVHSSGLLIIVGDSGRNNKKSWQFLKEDVEGRRR